MVGDVQQGGVDAAGARLQLADQQRQHMVGVQQRVVVGVDDLLACAVLQVLVFAGWREARERRRVAAKVRRPVVAQLMQHQHLRALRLREPSVDAAIGLRRGSGHPRTGPAVRPTVSLVWRRATCSPTGCRANAPPRRRAPTPAADLRCRGCAVRCSHDATRGEHAGGDVSVLVPGDVAEIDRSGAASCGVVCGDGHSSPNWRRVRSANHQHQHQLLWPNSGRAWRPAHGLARQPRCVSLTALSPATTPCWPA